MRTACIVAALALCLAIAPLCAYADTGLVGWWRFDEGRGDEARDSSGRGNHGEVNGARWVRGRFGTALRFTGRDSSISLPLPAGLDGYGELTVEVWVYWEGTGRYPNILSSDVWNPGGLLLFVSDNTCSFRLGRPGKVPYNVGQEWSEAGAPLVSFRPGRWYHLAATFRRPRIVTYVDGRPVGEAAWDHPVGLSGGLLVGRWGDPNACHNGLIDELKLYRRALTAGEVRMDYEKEASRRTAVPPAVPPYRPTPDADRPPPAAVTIENAAARLLLDRRARVIGLVEKTSGADLAARPYPSLATVRIGGRERRPVSCMLKTGRLTLGFGPGVAPLVLDVKRKPRWFTLKVLSADPAVEEVSFACVRVRPAKYVSGMAGMASDDASAACLRVLDLRSNVTVTGRPPLLQAVCPRERGIAGAGVALIVCPRGRVRPVLQSMLRAEGVVHSRLGGPWALDAPANRGSYLFSTAGEKDVDQWIALAKRAGMRIIHLCGWESALGHYPPRADLYPSGLAGLKAVCDRIHAAGLQVGMHTLTGCIAPNDAFVTPVPDRRLATDREFTLARPVKETDNVLYTRERPEGMDTIWAYASRGNVVRLDDELVMFSGYSGDPPYRLTGCTRGAFGTRPAAHEAGAKAGHLVAMYGAFYPDPASTLVDDVAECIAKVANLCRMDFLYQDGAEGMPGGWYGVARMRAAIYQRINHPIRIEASEWGYHSWPFHSVIGAWDHPCWGLDQFNDLHCAQIATFRAQDLLPGQLGWWVNLGPAEDHGMEMPEEMEYLCAKALGHDAPLSLQGVAPGKDAWNARQDEYLAMIGRYERLRLSGRVPEAVRAKLRMPGAHFRLSQSGQEWHLTPTDYAAHRATGLANGAETWTVTNRHAAQPVRLRIEALYSAAPYDSPEGITLAAFDRADEFAPPATAAGVTCAFAVSTEQVKAGGASGRLTATNTGAVPRAAWARITRTFPGELNMGACGALGVWVHGDGKGEVLNFQLTDSPLYYGRAFSDHYVDVDFTGWRYFELPLRERDAARHASFAWPYGAPSQVHRSPLMREHVTELNIYVNGIPRGETVTCFIGPVRALPITKARLIEPAISVAGRSLRFPVTLETGHYLEYEPGAACTVYDERGASLGTILPVGEAPRLATGNSLVELSCRTEGGGSARAKVTVITLGAPLRTMGR